jgi:hypothetical protein
MKIYWKNGNLVIELLGDVQKTEDGNFYLKKWSFNDGKTWICENDNEIDVQHLSFKAKSGMSIGKDKHMWYNKFNKKYLKERE